jgi:glycosyltransferase involved in cell wall biosynthesis
MISRVYYWVGLTVTQEFNTGVQRVTRSLAATLQKAGVEVIPVKWDGAQMAPISQAEADNFARWGGPSLKPPSNITTDLRNEWLIIPEITFPVVPPGSNVARLGKSLNMRVAAIFYDMIPLKTPELYNDETFAMLSDYWRTFMSVDIAFPISKTVEMDLTTWIKENGGSAPFTVPTLLAGEIPGIAKATTAHPMPRQGDPFHFLAIGTWEPRKNYPRVIRAFLTARQKTGKDIRLTIVGRKEQERFPDLHAEIMGLAANGNDAIRLHDFMDETKLNRLFHSSHATLFGSVLEGFGLPVLESLWRGLPCICHNGSALAEVAPGGGTIMVDMQDEEDIVRGISLLTKHDVYTKLSNEAVQRPIRTWDQYQASVLRTMNNVSTMMAYDPLG